MFLLTLQSLHFSDIMAAGSLHVLQCTFALSALGINYYQESKASLPKRFMISDLVLDGRFLHSSKAQFPIAVTLFGILILVSDSHPQKAAFPIFVTPSGMLMLVSNLQVKKFYLQYLSHYSEY